MIRKANVNDLTKLNILGNVVIKNFDTTYDLKSYINDDKYIVLIDEQKDIKAFLIILKNLNNFELELIVVDKQYRRCGIASNLLTYFIDNYCPKKSEIYLEVAVDNDNAIKLYKKFNFEIINIRKKYYHNSDALIMKRVIE